MQSPDVKPTVSALRELLGERLSTGASVLELHGRDEAYTPCALPDAVAFPESACACVR